MRHPTGNIPAQPLRHMWERHYEILRRLVAGDRQCDIAQSLGMTDARLSIIVNSPLFQASLMEMRTQANKNACDIGTRITNLAEDSMTILERAIRAKPGDADYTTHGDMKPVERSKLALNVMAIAGHGPVQKVASVSGAITADDIKELHKRAQIARTIGASSTGEAQQVPAEAALLVST